MQHSYVIIFCVYSLLWSAALVLGILPYMLVFESQNFFGTIENVYVTQSIDRLVLKNISLLDLLIFFFISLIVVKYIRSKHTGISC